MKGIEMPISNHHDEVCEVTGWRCTASVIVVQRVLWEYGRVLVRGVLVVVSWKRLGRSVDESRAGNSKSDARCSRINVV